MLNFDDADVAASTGGKLGAGIAGTIAAGTVINEARKGIKGTKSTLREAGAAANKAGHLGARYRIAKRNFKAVGREIKRSPIGAGARLATRGINRAQRTLGRFIMRRGL